MPHIIKQHPLKPIDLFFQENKQAPEFEVMALKQYKKAHDETWKRRLWYQEQKGQLMLLSSEMEDLDFSRFPLEQQLDIFEDALGISSGSLDLPLYEGEIDLDIGLFFDNTVRHNQTLQRLHGQITEAASHYNEAISSVYADDYLIDPIYFNVLNEVFQRYEEVEVDIVSLDKDYQDFLEAYNEVDKLYEDYIDFGQTVFEAYSKLQNESEHIYRRAEVVHERLDSL